jgi:amino acid adenylation domain-containing protein
MATQKITKEVYDNEKINERDYWIERLSGEIGSSNITLDNQRQPNYNGEKASLEIRLSDNAHQGLGKLASNSPFLIFVALLTSLKICIRKYTGNSSVVIGVPSRNKGDGAARGASALAIATNIDDNQPAKRLLLAVRESLLEAYAKQNYPFERLIRDLNLGHVENRCPLFDIAISLRNIHNPMPELKNDITITFAAGEDATAGVIEFNKSLFEAESIERFRNHFLAILDQIIQEPDRFVSDISLTTEAERHYLLVECNDTKKEFAEARSVHQTFEEHAAQRPEAIAVIFQDRQVTYKELNEEANQLAHYLRSIGVGPETLVGICLDRGVETIVAMLGTLKAGGAYLPLDPSYPADRISFMASDSQAPTILTQERCAAFFEGSDAQIICLETDWTTIAQQATENPANNTLPENLVYVIYTSGSTGRPKGALLTHGGLRNTIGAQAEGFGISAETRLLQFASFSFDASASEIFTALSSGAALWLDTPEALLPGPGLIRLLRDNAITHAILPPSVLLALGDAQLPDLKTIIAAGEACPAEVVRRWGADRTFINAYGPTETTICATLGVCRDATRNPTIGRPLWNTSVYILDEKLEPAPIGAPGELYVAGVSLARGYLNRADQTAERFLPDPYGEAGTRMYRTGDVARHKAGGEIEYLGRADQQVKIRGYRIELGEIEAALASNEGVRQAIVVAREDTPGEKRLVAYFTPSGASIPSAIELRAFLKSKLPDYMVPAIFIQLDSVPLSPNGKIALNALPSPQLTRPELETSYIAPRTPFEKTLADIWKEILGVEQVGVNDHFFDLGGHSLLAAQLVSRVREAFEVEIPLRWFFVGEPTVSGLAQVIEQFRIEQAEADELASALAELEDLSDEEVQALLSAEAALEQEQQV